MMIDSKILQEKLNDKSITDWIDKDESSSSYKQGYLSGIIKALSTVSEIEYLTEHGYDRSLIDFGFDDGVAESLKTITGAVSEKLKEIELTSHSEKNIVNGCIALMESVHQNMLEYMDIMGFEYDVENEEEIPQFRYSYFEIIQKLLLSRTSYGGGTSTRKKCKQLGLDSYEEIIIGE